MSINKENGHKKKSKGVGADRNTSNGVHMFFIFWGIICVVPIFLTISASLTGAAELSRSGFKLFPEKIDLASYRIVFKKPMVIIRAYGVTAYQAILGTVLSTLVTLLTAYPLARSKFRLKRFVSYFIYFPTLFSGGLTASYIIMTKYLHLTDSLWVLILPSLVAAFNIFMVRTYFQTLPDGLFEAAEIDGASELRICFAIAAPLSKPILATVAFLNFSSRWNEWSGSQLYIRSEEKYTLMYLLQRIMMTTTALLDAAEKGVVMSGGLADIPGDNLKMAYLVVVIAPMMIIFPFFQKYFTKGMVVGSVKG